MLNAITEENSPSTSNVDKTFSVNNTSEINVRDSFTRSSLRSQRAHKTVMKMLSELVYGKKIEFIGFRQGFWLARHHPNIVSNVPSLAIFIL